MATATEGSGRNYSSRKFLAISVVLTYSSLAFLFLFRCFFYR